MSTVSGVQKAIYKHTPIYSFKLACKKIKIKLAISRSTSEILWRIENKLSIKRVVQPCTMGMFE